MVSKRQEVRRVSAATRKYDNQLKVAEIRIKALFISINQRLANLQLSYEIVSNDIEIFQIKFSEHHNNEIDTETYLRERSIILNKIKSHNTEVAGIQTALLEIELLTETPLELDIYDYFFQPAKILGMYE
jgi:hypothetical protein